MVVIDGLDAVAEIKDPDDAQNGDDTSTQDDSLDG
jgi:hypothetical protein